jgi:surfeit locus 1 family protein
MRIGKYQFRANLIPTVMVLILIPVLMRLGFWQLDRAQQKRAIIASQNATLALPPRQIHGKPADSADLEFHRLRISGVFLDRYQIFIDNKIHQGQAGYDVVTPLRIDGSDDYVLVNRGWVPLGTSRAKLPSIKTPAQPVTVIGIAKYKTRDVAAFSEANRSNTGWPAIVRWIDIGQLHEETKLDLLPFMLLLDPKSGYGFVRDWHFVNMPPEKHLSYAVQWFALALALLVIYLVVNTKRLDRNETRDE